MIYRKITLQVFNPAGNEDWLCYEGLTGPLVVENGGRADRSRVKDGSSKGVL